MKTWKIIRIYKVLANDKAEALKNFHTLDDAGKSGQYFDAEFAVEPKATGFWEMLRQQVLG